MFNLWPLPGCQASNSGHCNVSGRDTGHGVSARYSHTRNISGSRETESDVTSVTDDTGDTPYQATHYSDTKNDLNTASDITININSDSHTAYNSQVIK